MINGDDILTTLVPKRHCRSNHGEHQSREAVTVSMQMMEKSGRCNRRQQTRQTTTDEKMTI